MITIIGAGPSGLTLAYYLKKHKLPYQILERKTVAASWARYYDHLRLHTRKENVALPGLKMPRSTSVFPTKDEMISYLRNYAEHFDFPIQTATEVTRAFFTDKWQLETSKGSIESSHLVVATGISSTPVFTELPGQGHYRGCMSQARDYRNPESFLDQSVLVVGAGNTGVGIALGLSEAGIKTGLVIRDGIQLVARPKTAIGTTLKSILMTNLPQSIANYWLSLVRRNYHHLGMPQPSKDPVDVTPVIGFELRDAVKQGTITVHPEIAWLNAGGALFTDGTSAQYTTILLATGFRANLDFIDSTSLNTPSLFKLGFNYPASEPFLVNIKKEARALANKLRAASEISR